VVSDNTAEILIAQAQDNLAASARDLSSYRAQFVDRDASMEYRRAPLPGSTVIPFDAPQGMAILEVPGQEPFRHMRIPGLDITVCGERPPNATSGYASGADAIDCLSCLDAYTEMRSRG
jgi:hypothetical protein